MGLYRDIIPERKMTDMKINMYQYVISLRERIMQACKEAMESLEKAGQKHREYANRGTKRRMLTRGDKVLIILPKNIHENKEDNS